MSDLNITGRKIIAIDTHCSFCEGGVVNSRGKELASFKVPTNIPALLEVIGKVTGPRIVVIEESSLADWLSRSLSPHVEQLIVADPHRNALIAKDGDKTDALDWRKLAELCRGGFIRAVHHPNTLARSILRQHVQLYHERVSRRVSEGHKVIWQARRFGVMARQRDLLDKQLREQMLKNLPEDSTIQTDMTLMLAGYDQLCTQVVALRKKLVEISGDEPMIARFCQLPGIQHVRAASFVAIVDTPFRFAGKQKLWKYAGIGLEVRQSGSGRPRLSVPKRCNRVLKSILLGAAKSAIASKQNVFAEQYQRWIDDGCSPRIAKRNLARSLATTMWGMWKSQSDFDAGLIAATASVLA